MLLSRSGGAASSQELASHIHLQLKKEKKIKEITAETMSELNKEGKTRE
jgi:hypothetical protein